MKWEKQNSGLGWYMLVSGPFVIEPEDLDAGIWELWYEKKHVKTGLMSECKSHAEWMNRQLVSS